MTVFFRLNAILVFITTIIALFGIYLIFSFPFSLPSEWSPTLRQFVSFFWVPTLSWYLEFVLYGILSYFEWYIAFLLIVLQINSYFLESAIWYLNDIMQYGFVYPFSDIASLLMLSLLAINLIGVFLWFGRIPVYYRWVRNKLKNYQLKMGL